MSKANWLTDLMGTTTLLEITYVTTKQQTQHMS